MIKTSASRPDAKAARRSPPTAYPFTAIVGQEEMKLALLLNVVDPLIGGVLIMGHRGTGKSTAVRAIADLLPQVWRTRNCHYGCDPEDIANLCNDCDEELHAHGRLERERSSVPVVNLPLGATEDRVCGTIDIERALKEGVKAFEPGLLARVNRGFLYVDEVNLLEDHLVDLLLDVAVTGRNTVEREGISLEHPARFVLIGSGNPEEGELRPQLVDRFGLCAEIQTLEDLDQRVEIVERREAFERDTPAFKSLFEHEQQSLRKRLARAGKLAGQVSVSKDLLREIAGLCLQLRVDGHRGELTIVRAARALAALEGRKKVTPTDVRRITPLALRHRLRRDPLDPTNGGGSRIEQALDDVFPEHQAGASKDKHGSSNGSDNGSGKDPAEKRDSIADNDRPRTFLAPEAKPASLSEQALNRIAHDLTRHPVKKESSRARRSESTHAYNSSQGRYSRAVMHRTQASKVALDASLRAAAVNACTSHSRKETTPARHSTHSLLPVTPCFPDLRFKAFKKKQGTLFIMAIDASGSMALNRIEKAKGALVWLLNRSYINRDRVGLVSFRGQNAEEVLGPSQSISRARRALDLLLMGGATPLASALVCSLNIARRARRQGTERIILIVFTDGRANVGLNRHASAALAQALIMDELEHLGGALLQSCVMTLIVDTQNRFTSGGEARILADKLAAQYLYL